ncbi:hypothetical protein BKM17_10105 [Pseudomonas syringae group genomosp. 3]|nr:hypothetical protein BKM17_10105 [Pseudomonas syringae group genomosp. 3]
MRVIRIILKTLALLAVATLLTRVAIVSGLVKAGLDTSLGDAVYTKLYDVFDVHGIEEAEDLVISVVLIASLLLVAVLNWLLSRFMAKKSRSEV